MREQDPGLHVCTVALHPGPKRRAHRPRRRAHSKLLGPTLSGHRVWNEQLRPPTHLEASASSMRVHPPCRPMPTSMWLTSMWALLVSATAFQTHRPGTAPGQCTATPRLDTDRVGEGRRLCLVRAHEAARDGVGAWLVAAAAAAAARAARLDANITVLDLQRDDRPH